MASAEQPQRVRWEGKKKFGSMALEAVVAMMVLEIGAQVARLKDLSSNW
jgi:hypothetical protein